MCAPIPHQAVISPESRERLIEVIQHNCEHVLNLIWKRFPCIYVEASRRKRNMESYNSVTDRLTISTPQGIVVCAYMFNKHEKKQYMLCVVPKIYYSNVGAT